MKFFSSKKQENAAENTKTGENQQQSSSVYRSILIGGAAGAIEVFPVGQVLWRLKTLAQQKHPLTYDPVVLCRGIVPNAASMIPITAIQVSLNRLVQTTFFPNQELSRSQKTVSAVIAGAGSALVGCPMEMTLTHQGKSGFLHAGTQLYQQGGARMIFRGLVATAARDSVYTTGALAVSPILKQLYLPYCKNETTAGIAAGVTAGVAAAIGSHPVDVIKTTQQSEIAKPLTMFGASKKIYAESGPCGFVAGLKWRGARVGWAVTTISLVTEACEKQFTARRSTP